MQTVNLYDFRSKKITTIPAAELAPGLVRAKVNGVDGEVYVDAADALENCVAICRHPPFPAEYCHIFEKFAEVFRDVYPITAAEWADGFRYDADADQEIEQWARRAGAFRRITAEKKFATRAWKQECFQIILAVFVNGSELALETVELEAISKSEAQQIVSRIVRGC